MKCKRGGNYKPGVLGFFHRKVVEKKSKGGARKMKFLHASFKAHGIMGCGK